MLEGQNIVVLDCETLRSADDCLYCNEPEGVHQPLAGGALCRRVRAGGGTTFTRIGWENKAALGLSIGCLYRYEKDTYQFFDESTLEAAMRWLVTTAPLIVTFNGESFDAPLMRAILRHKQKECVVPDALPLGALCDAFKVLIGTSSYDLLQYWWAMTPRELRKKGENGLGVISEANGFGTKELDGATAPRLWAEGRYAEVTSYCLSDVWKTRKLFELVCAGKPLRRRDGTTVKLPLPTVVRESTVYGIAHPSRDV